MAERNVIIAGGRINRQAGVLYYIIVYAIACGLIAVMLGVFSKKG